MKGARLWIGLGLVSLTGVAFAGCGSDTDPAQPGPAFCGNGVCEPGESSVDCNADCASCAGAVCGICGNGVVEAGENCDLTLVTKTCADFGFEAGGVSCKTDCTVDTAGCCNDDCATEGATRCTGNLIEACNKTAAGCRQWVPVTNCEDLGLGCDASNGAAACNGCVDACQEGTTHCNGTAIETCQKGVDNCLVWAATKDCSTTGQSCDATSGTATCSGTCVNQCTTQGEKQCSGNDLQTCVDNGGGCLYWSTTQSCAATGGSCNATTKVCESGCSNQCAKDGLQTCIGSVVNTCKKDVNGCFVFSPGEDCSAKGSEWLCKLTGSQTAACQPTCANPCTTVGEKRCQFNNVQTCNLLGNTCKEWQNTTTCPVGQTCSAAGGTPTCVTAPITGEDCGTAWEIKGGANTVNWTATLADHLTTNPSCGSSTLLGPDVVMRYNPTFTGSIDISIAKPASTRWTMVASDATCGTLTPSLACVSEYTLTSMDTTVPVSSGKPVYIYIRDTNSGTNPLSNPLQVTIAELNCAVFTAKATPVQPAQGSTTTTLSPTVEVDFDTSITTSKGIITLKGATTNLSYDLSTSPANLTWSNSNKKLTISTSALAPGDTVTVSWTGVEDATCKKAVPPPAWSFKVVTPPCTPGAGGMVGGTVTRYQTGVTSTISEYYVAADSSANGWVYFGSSFSYLYRVKKDGTGLENVYSAAALSSTNLGYGMLVDGNNIYTLTSTSSGNTGRIFRLSTNGGAVWSLLDYASFQGSPSDDITGAVSYKGQIYMLTNESSSTTNTEIWKAPATGSPPVAASFEQAISGQTYCSGLGVDDTYFYLACGGSNRLVRVARSNGALTLITDAWPLSTTSNGMATHDTNNDGKADYIYYKGATGDVYFVCNPSGTAYSDKLANFKASATSEYGLGFDPVAKKLYAYDSVSKELVVIQ
ncbi:MAG: hypothetical protein R3B13_40930 [Polyangiaceae bacterium]